MLRTQGEEVASPPGSCPRWKRPIVSVTENLCPKGAKNITRMTNPFTHSRRTITGKKAE